jgi:triacylglycerol esterase/lipase EstA (alpha/beta hydrolase family)
MPLAQGAAQAAAQNGRMKLARMLRAMLAVLALAAFGWLGFWALAGAWLVGGFGAAAVVLAHAPLMALEFALLRRANRADPAPEPTRAELLRAWAAEVLGAVVVFGWRQPFRWRRFADTADPALAGRRGVVLVHGFVCNRGLWNPWLERLRAAGVPVIAPNLEPLFGSIDAYVPLVEAAVRRMTRATGVAPLLVGHSMGGLAIRAWLRAADGDARVAGVVTIGSPHQGTQLARVALAPNVRQMRLGSAWLRTLAAAETRERRALFTCFYSHCDNIVFPCSTATLPDADNRHLRGHAHVHLVQHPEVFAEVLRRVQPRPPAGRPAAG